MYDLIIGKNTMHNLGVVLDFNQSTIQIDKILLSMRDIANLQLKSSITRALRNNSNHTLFTSIRKGVTNPFYEFLTHICMHHTGADLVTFGFGTLAYNGVTPNVMQEVVIDYISNEACVSGYSPSKITSTMMCTEQSRKAPLPGMYLAYL
jgi:hypothetical protein